MLTASTMGASCRGPLSVFQTGVSIEPCGIESTFSLISPGEPNRTPSMTKLPPTLADLRREIDRIDESMHRLLMERGEIIDTLIATKKTAESGSAFRPAREADMMKRLVERHKGLLP